MKPIIIIGLVLVVAIVVFLIFRKPIPVDKSLATYSGTLEDYRGDKKLVVVFTASWASVWKLTTEALKQLDFSRFDLCILDYAVDRAVIKRHGITILPTVALLEGGRMTKHVPNLTRIEQITDW